LFSAKQIVPSSLRKRISSYLVGDPEVDPSSTQNKLDDGVDKDAGVLVEMAETPSEVWESTVSVELANVDWAATDRGHSTPPSLTKTSDDHLNSKEDAHYRSGGDSSLNGPIGVGLGTTLTSNVLFSPGPMLVPETEVARLQALLAAQDRLIQEKECVIRDMQDQIIRQREAS
jgi:hypothetical protein